MQTWVTKGPTSNLEATDGGKSDYSAWFQLFYRELDPLRARWIESQLLLGGSPGLPTPIVLICWLQGHKLFENLTTAKLQSTCKWLCRFFTQLVLPVFFHCLWVVSWQAPLRFTYCTRKVKQHLSRKETVQRATTQIRRHNSLQTTGDQPEQQ